MKIHCQIFSESRELLEASVFVSTAKNKRIAMKFHDRMGYEIDLDLRHSEVITFEIHKEGFESLICKDFARKEGYVFVLGKLGMKYIRYGDSILPKNNYDDLICISGFGDGFKSIIDQLELEKVLNCDGKILNTDDVYRIKGKKQKIDKNSFQNTIKALRNNHLIQFSGYVAAIEASYTTVFSNKVKVHFKKDVSQSTIKKLVEQLNFTLVRHSQEDKYSIISLGGDFLDDLSDCIEKIYQTGLVDLIFPLTIATFPVDSIPNNFLWKGQYDHVIIEVKDAWTILEAANGSSQTFGTGDIIVGVTDDGLTPKDDGGVYTQNASFTGTVIEKDGTPIPKIFKLQDFRTASFGDNNNTPIIRNGNSSTHGVNVCGIISASPNLLYGTAGVTGNSQLLSFIIQNVTATQQIQAIRWGAGIKEYIFNTNTLPKLAKGFDLLACSIAYNYTSSMSAQHVLTDEFADLVKDVLLIARNGRGALMVFSAGNENSTVRFLPPPVGGSASNRFSAYENVLSIGATSFYPDYLDSFDRPIERKAVYSNFGKIDFCAPSSNGGRAY